MSDEFSGVPASLDLAAGTPGPDPNAIALVALLAVVAALASSLTRQRRRRLAAELAQIAEDWERAGAGAALKEAATRFIRPALALLRADEAQPLPRRSGCPNRRGALSWSYRYKPRRDRNAGN